MKDGVQLFSLDYNVLDDITLKNKIKAIKIIVKSAFGENKTYINQVMLYENNIQEMNIINESIKSNNNSYQHEFNLPEDLSNSQSNEEIDNSLENKVKKNKDNKVVKKDNNKKMNKEKKNNNNKDNIVNKGKKKIIDYISETHSKVSLANENHKRGKNDKNDKNESIKVEENNIINDSLNNEQEENEVEENEESNQIIPTSNELQYSYVNKYERNTSPNNNNKKQELKENPYIDENIPSNNNKSKKVQKLEKILKQNILKNDFNKTNQNQMYIDNYIENQDEDYEENEKYNHKFNYNKNKTINNINNYPSLTPILKNNFNIQNTDEKNSNIAENSMQNNNNNIQNYFKINANTPNRFTVSGYEYLISKKRPYTPKINEMNLNRNTIPANNKIVNNEYKNKTSMEGFIRNNNININCDIKNSKAYETLEMQLQDMEQHLQNMALNRDISSNSSNNYISKTNRENKLDSNKYFHNDIHINNNYIDKKTKNQSMISNGSSYINDEQKNVNTNMTNNIYNNSNNNYFNKYNSQNLNVNNEEETIEINRRIDNLEKNLLEINEELNNISSNIKSFLNKDNFLYNFKDSIKQICYDFFTERVNMDNNEQIKNENENEYRENSQNSGEYSEEKNNPNDNNKIEEEINKKIDEKLEYLFDNLQNQIFEKYLQPSINEIEKSMKKNIEDIKEKVDSINYTNNNSKQLKNNYYNNSNIIDDDNNDIYNGSLEFKTKNEEENNSKDDFYQKSTSKMKKEHYEKISRLGEQLYGKLLEKEKKLKLLKQETMKNMENIN